MRIETLESMEQEERRMVLKSIRGDRSPERMADTYGISPRTWRRMEEGISLISNSFFVYASLKFEGQEHEI